MRSLAAFLSTAARALMGVGALKVFEEMPAFRVVPNWVFYSGTYYSWNL